MSQGSEIKLPPVAGAESQGAEIKLPPVAEAEITNCGSGSFLFTTDSKKFYRKKIMVAEPFFVHCFNFNYILPYYVNQKRYLSFQVIFKTIWSRG